jgi:hypothetical protein
MRRAGKGWKQSPERLLKKWLFAAQDIFSDNASGASLPSRYLRKKYDSRAKPLPEFFSNLLEKREPVPHGAHPIRFRHLIPADETAGGPFKRGEK